MAVAQERGSMEHGNMQTTCKHPAHDDDDGHEVMSMLLQRQGWVEGSPLHVPGKAAFSVPTCNMQHNAFHSHFCIEALEALEVLEVLEVLTVPRAPPNPQSQQHKK